MKIKKDRHAQKIVKKAEPSPVPRTALSMEEFASSFGISRSMAYKMFKDKMYVTFMVGRRRFVDVEEAKALAARLTAEASQS